MYTYLETSLASIKSKRKRTDVLETMPTKMYDVIWGNLIRFRVLRKLPMACENKRISGKRQAASNSVNRSESSSSICAFFINLLLLLKNVVVVVFWMLLRCSEQPLLLFVLLFFFYRVTNERALQLIIRRRARDLFCTLLFQRNTHTQRERERKNRRRRRRAEREALEREKSALSANALSRGKVLSSFL